MIEKIVNNNTEFEALVAQMKEAGYQWVGLSNAGLPAGKARATFIDASIDITEKPSPCKTCGGSKTVKSDTAPCHIDCPACNNTGREVG